MKKRMLSGFLAFAMMLSLIPAMRFTASAAEPEEQAGEYSEVIRFSEVTVSESEHFRLSAGWVDGDGWYVDGVGHSIVIESKTPGYLISSIRAVIGFYGDQYGLIGLSSGVKAETGGVPNLSTVTVTDVNSSRLEFFSTNNAALQIMDVTVHYIKVADNPDDAEVIRFSKVTVSESEHFRLSAGWVDKDGWYVDGVGHSIAIESKTPGYLISAVQAVIGFYGDQYGLIGLSSGIKVGNSGVPNLSTVTVTNVDSNRLEFFSTNNATLQIKDVTVYFRKADSEVLAFNGSTTAESEHFTLTGVCADKNGWAVGGGSVTNDGFLINEIVIKAKSGTSVLTEIEAIVTALGAYYSDVQYSAGIKSETGAVEDGSAVRVKQLRSGELVISSSSLEHILNFGDITVYYDHVHDFSGEGRDNGDGTHSPTCSDCGERDNTTKTAHTYRPTVKVSDDPLTYHARCTGCPNEIDDLLIPEKKFDCTGSMTYEDIEEGMTLRGGARLKAEYSLGDAEMIVYINGKKVADVGEGQYWTAPQCVRCERFDSHWFSSDPLEIWFRPICEYTFADCETPETCVYCGHAEGDPLGHDWKAASCTEPAVCLRCEKTEGTPAGHKWVDATCTEPKTCSVCLLTDGAPLGHDFRIIDGAIRCIVCGNEYAPAVTDEKVTYIDRAWDAESKTVTDTEKVQDGIILIDENTTMIGNGRWYAVRSDVTNDNRISVGGTANLILCDGAKLEAPSGIGVTEGNTLNVYGQSEGSGKLNANGLVGFAGIGSGSSVKAGTVNIYGGTVTATSRSAEDGDEAGAGIGGGTRGRGGIVSVYGGTVTATGSAYSAGIGGGYAARFGGDVTVYGGTVYATGGKCGAGIGGGAGGSGGSVTVYGGSVVAAGGEFGAGIGGGTVSTGGTVTVNGGTVYAVGGFYAPGIGGAEEGAELTVNGGNVTAAGGEFAAGVGGAAYGNGGKTVVNGGFLLAVSGGHDSRAIGRGSGGSEDGTVTAAPDSVIRAGENGPDTEVTPEDLMQAKYKFVSIGICAHGAPDGTLIRTEAVDATCTEAGNHEYYTCPVCGKFFSDAEGTKELEKDGWVTEALGHSYPDGAYTDNGDGTHTAECARCRVGFTEACEYVGGICTKCGGKNYVPGDVNGDGRTDSEDVLLLKLVAADLETLSDEKKKLGDVNHDGVIDSKDVLLLKRAIAGLVSPE